MLSRNNQDILFIGDKVHPQVHLLRVLTKHVSTCYNRGEMKNKEERTMKKNTAKKRKTEKIAEKILEEERARNIGAKYHAKLKREKKKVATKPKINADRKPCECGCGGFPAGKRSKFLPGHDMKLKSMMLMKSQAQSV